MNSTMNQRNTSNCQMLLLKAIRGALWGEKIVFDLNYPQFCSLMTLAEDQAVIGLVFDVVSTQKTKIDFETTMKYIGVQRQIESQNINLNKEISYFASICEKMVFPNMIVKGQTVGILYPKSTLRSSGDIDVLFKDDYQKSKEVLERTLNVTLPPQMVEKEISFYIGDTRFDLHKSIVDFCTSKNEHYWEKVMENAWKSPYQVTINGIKINTLPPTYNAIYIFLHLFYHFIREGVALRQFCDWTMVLHHYKSSIDYSKITEILCVLGLYKAYKAFGTIVVDELGLPANEFPVELNAKDRKWKNDILHDIFKGGNFGKNNHIAKNEWLFKIETFQLMARNCFKYYKLAPGELRMMIPKMIIVNWRLLVNRLGRK